jgi:hypothetical protein
VVFDAPPFSTLETPTSLETSRYTFPFYPTAERLFSSFKSLTQFPSILVLPRGANMASTAYKAFMSAAQALPGFNTSHKPYTQISYADLSAQGMPLTPQQSCEPSYQQPYPPNVSPKHEILFQRFRKIRRWTKIAVVTSHVFSGLFSVFMEAVMFYVTYKFYKTKDYPTPDRPWGPWPKNAKLWPTYMLAAASVVTTLLSIGMLIALCCRAKRKAAFFSILYMLVHVVCWAIVAVLYRVGKTSDDLWGWSCTDQAKEVQKILGSSVLNFENLCKFQVSLPLTPRRPTCILPNSDNVGSADIIMGSLARRSRY